MAVLPQVTLRPHLRRVAAVVQVPWGITQPIHQQEKAVLALHPVSLAPR